MLNPLPQWRQHQLILRRQSLISSCTNRLLQLQNQLQAKYLKQQLISSVVMKQASLHKLLQQQNLLMSYLKQQLKQLQIRNIDYLTLQTRLNQLQSQYLTLNQLKINNQREYQQQLARDKNQYHQLHSLLNQSTKESSILYQLILKFKQRNHLTQSVLTSKIQLFCTLKQQHSQATQLKSISLQQNSNLHTSIHKYQNQNTQFSQNYIQKTKELQSNKKKLLDLQAQVQRLQIQKQKLQSIQKVAQKDNLIMKQALKDKISQMKKQQQTLKKLNKQKQILLQQKTTQTQKRTSLAKQNQQFKQSYNQQVSLGQSKRSQYEVLIKDKIKMQSQIQKLEYKTQKLHQQKSTNLQLCAQNQQNIQRNIYFIDQYINLNFQLINQMNILLLEQVNKSNLNLQYNKVFKQRSYQIIKLKQFLTQVQQQMLSTEHSFTNLVRNFNNYKI